MISPVLYRNLTSDLIVEVQSCEIKLNCDVLKMFQSPKTQITSKYTIEEE